MSTDSRAALIIAGGLGSRLWPMSRKALPKQFQHLLGKETPFQHMVRLVTQVVPLERVFVMAVPQFRETIRTQVPHLNPDNILIEPAQRDTAPAVILGMFQIEQKLPDATVATLWSDHLVLDEAQFAKVLTAAFESASDHSDALTSVGTKPTKPDPALGYIHMGAANGTYQGIQTHVVEAFVEKPDQETANRYFASHKYLWNVGYNVMNVSSFRKQLQRVQAEHRVLLDNLYHTLESGDSTSLSTAYETLPKTSIDYFFVQKLDQIFVVPADMGWSDIGTWTTLHKMMVEKSGEHLVTQGEVHSINTENSLVFAKDRPITLVGVKDLIVVDTGDTLLVMHHDAAPNDLKQLVQDTLSETNPELL